MSNCETITSSEAAKRLGKTQRTIIRMCQAGKLKSQWGVSGNGKPGYLIEWTEESKVGSEGGHEAFLGDWVRSLNLSMSPTTVYLYKRLMERYFSRYRSLDERSMQLALQEASGWSGRQVLHGALGNYRKYLVESRGFRDVDKIPKCSMRPDRPIRRTVLLRDELDAVFRLIDRHEKYSPHQQALNAALVAFMVFTGARVSEVATVTLEHVRIKEREVTLLRKGGVWHDTGMPTQLVPYLETYLRYRVAAPGVDTFFVNLNGQPLCRRLIGARLKRISKRLGVDFTAHGLRRTFATLNSQKGRSIEVISKALNHSKLSTTQLYLRTTQKQVVESMKAWDF